MAERKIDGYKKYHCFNCGWRKNIFICKCPRICYMTDGWPHLSEWIPKSNGQLSMAESQGGELSIAAKRAAGGKG
jgi:hypothetical protein